MGVCAHRFLSILQRKMSYRLLNIDHDINIQLAKYISSCYDLHIILLSKFDCYIITLNLFSIECRKTKTKVFTTL